MRALVRQKKKYNSYEVKATKMKKYTFIIMAAISFLVSCGGGGGGGGDVDSVSPPSPSGPPISITISSSLTQLFIGDEITLTWTSSNADRCEATGSWSGDKALSGTEIMRLTKSGNLSFALLCSSATSSSVNRSITLDVTPAYNAYTFIDGPTVFTGFYLFKKKGASARLKSIQVTLDINDSNSLFISRFRYNEDRYLALFQDADGTYDGLGYRLGNSGTANEDGELETYYLPQVSESFHATNQIILNANNAVNPFENFPPIPSDDLEKFSADITLSFTEEYASVNGHGPIQMTAIAFPKESETLNNSAFVGSSNDNDSYSFLYMVDRRAVLEFQDNPSSESDIFDISWGQGRLASLFLATPNLEASTVGIRVKNNKLNYSSLNNYIADSLKGASAGDAIDITSPSNPVQEGGKNVFAVKYLQPETLSDQRAFLKYSLLGDCSAEAIDCKPSAIVNPQLYFFMPNKKGLVGLELGGYLGLKEETNARFLFNAD